MSLPRFSTPSPQTRSVVLEEATAPTPKDLQERQGRTGPSPGHRVYFGRTPVYSFREDGMQGDDHHRNVADMVLKPHWHLIETTADVAISDGTRR